MNICFTFDDGIGNQIRFFNETKMVGTYFINPTFCGIIAPDNPLPRLSIDQLKYLIDSGNEIGYHGWDHKQFTKHKTESEMIDDIEKSLEWFNKYLNITPTTMSHPSHCLAWIEVLQRYFVLLRDYYSDCTQWRIPDTQIPTQFQNIGIAMDHPCPKEFLRPHNDKPIIFKMHAVTDQDIANTKHYIQDNIFLFKDLPKQI